MVSNVATTGFTFNGSAAAAGAECNVLILQGAAFQISGALTQVTNAGEVERAIAAAAAMSVSAATGTSVYVVLDNGVDTGVYRALFTASAADSAVDSAAEISAVTLVAVLTGISDAGTLVGTNFA
jgi:hypothetical protein